MPVDPQDLVPQLRELADVLERCPAHDRRQADVGLCRCLRCTAELLAARGFPSSTLGTGSRSSDTTSSTERAAGVLSDSRHPHLPRHADLDVTLAARLRALRYDAGEVAALVVELRSHDTTADPRPAGTGDCQGCGTFVLADPEKGRRIRSGLGPACYAAWLRWQQAGKGDRSAFLTDRRRDGGTCALSGRRHLSAVPARRRTERYDDGRGPATTVERTGWWGHFVFLDGVVMAGPFTTPAEAAEARERCAEADRCTTGPQWVEQPPMDGAKPA